MFGGKRGDIGLREGEGGPGERGLGLQLWCRDTGDDGFVDGVLSEERRDVDGVDFGD